MFLTVIDGTRVAYPLQAYGSEGSSGELIRSSSGFALVVDSPSIGVFN